VQIIKAVMLLGGATFMALAVLFQFGFSPEALFTKAVEVHSKHDAIMAPGALIKDPISAISVGMALMFGTAGLPHILQRFFTVPNAKEARKSVAWATTWIGYFYILTFIIGFGAIVNLIADPGAFYVDGDIAKGLKGGGNMAAVWLSEAVGGKTLGDLIGAAKAAPNKLSYGSWGVGSPGHLGGEQLEEATGTKMTHVAFRDIGQLYGGVGSGELAWAWASIPSSQGVYKAGKLRYLAVAAPKRLPQLPDVPTMGEAGGPAGFEVNSFVVLAAPKGMSAALRSKINADVARAVADPEVKARFEAFAFETLPWTPEEILKQADAKSKVYEALVKRGNISLD
jgi:hypothetical protein